MELVIPYLLIIIGFDPDKPSETMALQHSLHISQAACEAQGTKFLEDRKDYMAKFPARYRYFCIPVPGDDELDGVFDRAFSDRANPDRNPEQ
ncbi:hypothetical protein [Parerythrobacter jejuensis]|uniref:Uncharacterized protein n=1 Tax=Parerythrobacter jejuensis TaxID=795812 RepID=A0A845AUQ6_9SPHN|nr:hypothetical protein [Parerythrobacter jejuensis]MXP32541.1 hypothetical protein [Parerythrobacter jejuensis]